MNRLHIFPLLCLALCWSAIARGAIDITFNSAPGSFAIADSGKVAAIYVDPKDYPGVVRAAGDLADDIRKVSGVAAKLNQATAGVAGKPILLGTIGHSELIAKLIAEKKIDVTAIDGKWESTLTAVVDHPLPGVDSALVIAGSDKRGTIYGIYDISAKIGVSPWYWWADAPTPHHEAVFVSGSSIVGSPAVKYRGIFLNDEAPCLTGWAKGKFGGLNSKVYTRIFELLLRLRANYLWPAMWGNAFNEDDAQDPKLADEYGIVMGTSHQEPMMRAQAEWDRRAKGKDWNYATDPQSLDTFWREGLHRNANFENLITIGMRGRNDTEMIKGGTVEQSMQLLEKIVGAQRKIIADEVNPDVTKVPQVWCLYKEVQSYYEQGMRVPDDVTLLWSDDNWGDLRRLPTADERKRSGGAGIYYHFDYVGDPRNYKWLNTNPLPKIWDQLNLAYNYGADRVWVVNVGDLKPMELPISFFMSVAWDPKALPKERIGPWTHDWAAQQFGEEHATEIADVLSKYGKYNGWRKPELLEAKTFSLTNYHEAERVEAAWQALADEAESINAKLPAESRDAFYQLALYPAKACATVAELYIAQARNQLYAKQKRASTNDQAARVQQLFDQDKQLSDYYNHTMAAGKWNHMMDQSHIGYTGWQDPKTNILAKTQKIDVPAAASLGVAVEESESAWPGDAGEPVLPAFDSVNNQRRSIEVFNRGSTPFKFTAASEQPWIRLSQTDGELGKDTPIWVSIDWSKAPVGQAKGSVIIARGDAEKVAVQISAVRGEGNPPPKTFGGLTGPIAISAEKATRNVPAGDVKWEAIPDYGRGSAGMEIIPDTAASATPASASAHLEYDVYIAKVGDVAIDSVIGPTLDFVPGRGLRFAVSLDNEPPQVIDAIDKSRRAHGAWQDAVRDNSRTLQSQHHVDRVGVHTVKFWMVDPAVVLEKIIVHQEKLAPSYFGPPESAAN